MTLPRRLAVRVFVGIGRAADRAARVATYAAAGTIRRRDLQDGIREAWEEHYGRDIEDVPGLLPWEQDLVERFVRPDADVLLVGCGSGRDVVALAERGCRVTGIEPSGRALQSARRVLRDHPAAATLVEGFFEDTPVSGGFDAVIFSYYCYSLMPEARRRVDALRKAAAALKPGGHILVSHGVKPRPRAALIALARLVGAVTRTDWRVEPGDMVWENRGPRPSFSYTHAFEPGEVEREAAAARLRPVFSRTSGDGRAIVLAPL